MPRPTWLFVALLLPLAGCLDDEAAPSFRLESFTATAHIESYGLEGLGLGAPTYEVERDEGGWPFAMETSCAQLAADSPARLTVPEFVAALGPYFTIDLDWLMFDASSEPPSAEHGGYTPASHGLAYFLTYCPPFPPGVDHGTCSNVWFDALAGGLVELYDSENDPNRPPA